jgi:phage-related protein (TIGR01555 family)
VTVFTCTDTEGEELEEFNAEVQLIYSRYIINPLIRALLFTRLYGHCGILVGYADGNKDMAQEATPTADIQYLQALPKKWISEIVLKKDDKNNLSLPVELAKYTIDIGNNKQDIDASRITHLRIPSLKEESLDGESVLLCIYDDLTVLKSMTWGAGQAMWRNGAGLTVFIAPDSEDPQAQIDAIDEVTTDINAMTVLTMPPGTDVITGKIGSLNPKEYFDVCIQMISIGSRIPASLLRGSVAGSLTASEKDRKDYFELLDNIQKEILTPALLDILHRFQVTGQLPEQEFLIKWARTPVWEMEEHRAKLLVAQTELTEAKTEKTLREAGQTGDGRTQGSKQVTK